MLRFGFSRVIHTAHKNVKIKYENKRWHAQPGQTHRHYTEIWFVIQALKSIQGIYIL